MWRDDDVRIMEILNTVEASNKESVPTVCPICGKREGHLYFHRYEEGHEAGGMWMWCSACRHSVHARCKVPEWWINLGEISFEKLAALPDYLEENKNCIDSNENGGEKLQYLIDSYTRQIQGKGGLIEFVRYNKNSEVYNILNEKLGGELEKVWGILKNYM